MTHPLRVEIADLADHTSIVVAGDVDFSTSPQLKRVLDAILERDPPVPLVRADLNDVNFMDSAGIGLLLVARSRACRSGSRFVVSAASPFVRRTFEVAGIDRTCMADTPRKNF